MKRVVLWAGFLFISYANVSGQVIDSLERKLSATQNETERIRLLNRLGQELTFIDVTKAFQYANESLTLSTKLDDKEGKAYAYRILSSLHSSNANFYISMDYLQRSLNLFKLMNDSVGIANCYITLGHTYRRLLDRENEVKHHKLAYEILLRLNIPERIGVTAHNLGESYYNIGNYSESRRLTQKAIQINDSLKNLSVLSSCYKVMGLLDFADKNYQKAEANFNQVLSLSARLGDQSQKIATIESLIQLAALSKLKGDSKAQLDYLKRAVEFGTKNNLSNYLMTIYTNLMLYYSSISNSAQVSRYLVEYQSVSDSVNQKQIRDRSRFISSVVAVHKLEEEKDKLELDNSIEREKVTERNFVLISISIFLVVLLFLVFRLASANRREKIINRVLLDQAAIIEQQKQHLEKLNTTKDKFFSIVAHDLKTPLNSLSSFSRILIDHHHELSAADISKMATELHGSVDNTIKMADNLIAWARVQMNDYELRPQVIDLDEIILNVCELYKSIAQKKGVSLSYQRTQPVKAYGDQNHITFVVRNFINNAIKFTAQGGIVKVSAVSLSDGKVEIVIADSGVGLSDEKKARLFSLDKKQNTKGTDGEGGTGLGLMLCYEFIKLNNGSITVESTLGQGSVFRIILLGAQNSEGVPTKIG